MTRSLYQVPYFELTCAPKDALSHHVFRGARRQSVKIGVSKSKRINVAGQGQPKHLNIPPHGQYHVYAAFFKHGTVLCCDPTLSVLVMLVSRNVFHVVSALQSIAYNVTNAGKSMSKISKWPSLRPRSLKNKILQLSEFLKE